MKLVKLNTDHYIVVDNSEIKEGDWMIRDGEQPTLVTPNFWWDFGVPYKKITHSTQPLELLSENGLSGMGFSKVRPLNVFEVKELIGEVDVEKKAEEWYKKEGKVTPSKIEIRSYSKGYNQALEDNKEKKYTEQDIRNVIRIYSHAQNELTIGDIIKSLQPETEWEVEFDEQGQLRLL